MPIVSVTPVADDTRDRRFIDAAAPVHPVISPPPRFEKVSFYRPELDSLRFVAFLGVLIFHAMPLSLDFYTGSGVPSLVGAAICGAVTSGAFGVDLFFALSAFLITTLLLRERETNGRVDVRSFYIRRILRIWPLYFAFILFAVALQLVVKSQHLGLPYVAGFFLLAGNWIYVLYGLPHSIAIPLWSISIEEQFYLTWPLIVRGVSRRRMAGFAVAVLVIATVARLALVLGRYPQAAIEYNTLARLDPIALGILLALGADRLPQFTDLQRLALAIGSVVTSVLVGTCCGLQPLDNSTVSPVGTIVGPIRPALLGSQDCVRRRSARRTIRVCRTSRRWTRHHNHARCAFLQIPGIAVPSAEGTLYLRRFPSGVAFYLWAGERCRPGAIRAWCGGLTIQPRQET